MHRGQERANVETRLEFEIGSSHIAAGGGRELADDIGDLHRLQEALRRRLLGRNRLLLLRVEGVSLLQAFSVKRQEHETTLARCPSRVDLDVLRPGPP